MENIKKLGTCIDRATSDAHDIIPQSMLDEILEIINTRVDMPKYAIASVSKRMALKNKRVLINIFSLLEFLAYKCELSLYSQISAKQFLFKISGLLMNKDIDASVLFEVKQVKQKIMQTVFCWEQLFRPHEDLLPLFFSFYAGLLRNNFDIPHSYISKYRPEKLKEYSKKPETTFSYGNKKKKEEPSSSSVTMIEEKTFEEIRQNLILTNEIIDNISPHENVKDNDLLMELIQKVKECEKKVNNTINENPSERIMEMALAANDDINITYRRYKDLQRNRKPEPFILTEMTSQIIKEQQIAVKLAKKNSPVKKQEQNVEKVEKKNTQQANIFDLLDNEPEKPATKPKKEENLLDTDYNQPVKVAQNKPNDNVFDLLGEPKSQPPKKQPASYDQLLGTMQFTNVPQPTSDGLVLNMNQFKTDADMKPYNNKSAAQKLQDLTADWLNK